MYKCLGVAYILNTTLPMVIYKMSDKGKNYVL